MTEPKSFLEILAWTPDEARAYLEAMRWPDGPVCPNGCASEVYRFEAKVNRTRKDGTPTPARKLLKCKQCRRQFTATVGTIFEDSKVPLNKWLAAIYLMCASKKGISAHQIHRMLEVTYKTAWFMCHRVRHAMKDKNPTILTGTVEVDETYVGGRQRGHMRTRKGKKKIGPLEGKTPVFGILERGGRVRAIPMPIIDKGLVESVLRHNVEPVGGRLISDESSLYTDTKHLGYDHYTVKHKETYVTGEDIHTQGIEGFWSLLKRGLNGTFHHVKPSYLRMYCDEFAFRYNARKMTDAERFDACLAQTRGRLAWYAKVS